LAQPVRTATVVILAQKVAIGNVRPFDLDLTQHEFRCVLEQRVIEREIIVRLGFGRGRWGPTSAPCPLTVPGLVLLILPCNSEARPAYFKWPATCFVISNMLT
jgi:hypothetical protein